MCLHTNTSVKTTDPLVCLLMNMQQIWRSCGSLHCENMLKNTTLSTMQPSRCRFGWRFGCVMLVMANVARTASLKHRHKYLHAADFIAYIVYFLIIVCIYCLFKIVALFNFLVSFLFFVFFFSLSFFFLFKNTGCSF